MPYLETVNSKALQLLPVLKTELGSDAEGVADENLLKFLRWKPNVERASKRFRAFCKWQTDNPGLFDETLRLTRDKELLRLLKSEVLVSPPGLTTTEGSPVLIGRLRNNDMKDGRTPDGVCRALFYTIDRILENPESSGGGVTIIHDLRGFNPIKNAHVGIPKIIFTAIFGHFPIRVKAIYLLQAPWGFHPFFKMITSVFLPAKMRSRCHFIDKLGQIEDIVDKDLLLSDVGGKTDFSIEEWVEKQKKREEDGSFTSMTELLASK
jgi:hypothetical protein